MPRLYAFPPIVSNNAKCLILGSMPGQASLQAQQYYAHPHNSFWPIMGALLNFYANLPYASRVQALKRSGIAVWDVLHSCQRSGSLDTAIQADSIITNDFVSFFAEQPQLQRIYFNGATAESLYQRYVLPQLPSLGVCYTRLPSTSPAHAARSFTEKLASWQVITDLCV